MLNISNAQPENTGKYFITLQSSAGRTEAVIEVVVYGKYSVYSALIYPHVDYPMEVIQSNTNKSSYNITVTLSKD